MRDLREYRLTKLFQYRDSQMIDEGKLYLSRNINVQIYISTLVSTVLYYLLMDRNCMCSQMLFTLCSIVAEQTLMNWIHTTLFPNMPV